MSNSSKVILSLVFLVKSATASYAVECLAPRYDTLRTNFIASGNFGSVAFAQNSFPPRLAKMSGVGCFKLDKRKRIYFFVDHKGPSEVSETSFLAVQIIKTFINDDQHQYTYRAHGSRKGIWERGDNELSPIENLKSFGRLTAYEFSQFHKAPEKKLDGELFDDSELVTKFRNKFWHSTPKGSDISSLEFPEYWYSAIDERKNIQVENLLIRFTTVSKDKYPQKYKTGIPFNTGIPAGLVALEVRVQSPVSPEFTHRIMFDIE
tara:strand:- start:3615 stop:4403 length:789 start_codon:yes stop_codon:yes gene_type:complete